MSKPTENDWKAFNSISEKEKADLLFLYLCKDTNSMTEVINQYYHTSDSL